MPTDIATDVDGCVLPRRPGIPTAQPQGARRRRRTGPTAPAPESAPVSPGRVLSGRFVVGEVIGSGGMAVVRRGRDLQTGRWVAVKALRSTVVDDPLFRTGLRREARVLRGLDHACIVAFHGTGPDGADDADPHGAPYIVMEYVAGWTLRDLLTRGELTPRTSIEHLLGVLSALGASHRAGVVHRDIKPANVMVTAAGDVKLVDFGIARAMGEAAATVTQSRAFLGTPAYLSPEQARGATTDARSDVYSAGCLLFELLTGRPPFRGDDAVAVAFQHVHEEAPPAGTGVASLDAVIAKALAKDRDRRFQSAHAFHEALRSVADALDL
nr:protein kinase [uncultured Actinotalea sp.]